MLCCDSYTAWNQYLNYTISAYIVIFLSFLAFCVSPPQNYLRKQEHSKNSHNLILETLKFLDCVCGVTTGGLVLLSLYIHSNNVELITQTLVTLTEYCQGPCHENQVCGGREGGKEGGRGREREEEGRENCSHEFTLRTLLFAGIKFSKISDLPNFC